MRAVVQRVSRAAVRAGDEELGRVGWGLLVLLAVGHGDSQREVDWMVRKLAEVRVFGDGDGKMNRSLADVGGELLLISQFTLLGDVQKGRRPSFTDSAPPAVAEPLIEAVARGLRARGLTVATGRFGAMMEVELVNQGPVTLILDTPGSLPDRGDRAGGGAGGDGGHGGDGGDRP
jgi:D-aminoacyl-tRNA deacylase